MTTKLEQLIHELELRYVAAPDGPEADTWQAAMRLAETINRASDRYEDEEVDDD